VTVLREARKAVFGETWGLPLAVALLVGASVALKHAAPGLWEHAGGWLLLAAVAGLLVWLVGREHR
jgi:hypothetical protein